MIAAVSDELVEAIAVAARAPGAEKLRRYEGLVDWVMLIGATAHVPGVALRQTERIISTFAADHVPSPA